MTATANRPTLVLNRSWTPVNVIPAHRAIVMLWNDSARAIDPIDYQTYNWEDWSKLKPSADDLIIRSAKLSIRLPEVVTLTDYDKMPTGLVSFNRRNIFKRDHYTCQYCGIQPSNDELTIDHVLPVSRQGETSWTNCVLACVSCNKKKAARLPHEAGMKLRKKPVKPAWKPLYASPKPRLSSWSKFISSAYWEVELQD